ncbi:hypothetical protein GCM10007978_19520 [Shewanella hanedai]|uniref:Uncharacterized protein n=1 Tax=Shewanella hanedai TaxID=25 RepID=A0A553JMD8_SHEHA|nr:hypothetical protein [Shewanella hanedai]TRY13591.1 hypothetical protein FN961_15255 [Shewanella hanedai]GGI81812.1 hypothetical protein GCM10007978_19520 [Shewanella hanedai]
MDRTLAAMLARADADPQQGQPTPLVDAALEIVNDIALSYIEKQLQIDTLQQQAKDRELELFGEVWESLHAITPLEEITAADGKPVTGKPE